jgi:integrase
MAEVVQRVWKSGPRRVKRTAWGYTVMLNGKQVRKTNAAWTEDDARAALVEAQRDDAQRGDTTAAPPGEVVDPGATSALASSGVTLEQAQTRFLDTKRAERKKTVRDDAYHLARLVKALGADTPLSEITAARIAQYRTERAQQASQRRLGETVSAAAVNHELRVLRHLLHLAADEWTVIARAPRIRLLREPQGRLRWLEPAEEARLLAACLTCGGEALRDMVLVALESGMRQGEIVALTWERIDFTRGVFQLEITKSGRRREVPMRQALYDRLTALPGPREGRLWPRRFPRKAWEAAVREAKLEDFTFHDTRHHFASWFIMRGGSLPALQQILGHRDVSMTLRYAHLAPAHLRVEIERTAAISAHAQHMDDKIGSASHVSPRKAGVAQRQSN